MIHIHINRTLFSTVSFLFLLLLCQNSVAQNKGWLPGKVVFKDGKKSTGKIEYNAWSKNPERINFTDSLNNHIVLTPTNTSVVEITGRDVYHGAIVSRYMNSLDVNDLKDAAHETEKEIAEPVFLRVLTTGNVLTLFSYKDEVKSHYFIKDRKDSIIALRYVLFFISNTMQVQENYFYRDQFMPYTTTNEKAEKYRKVTAWRNDEMIKLVKMINNNTEKGIVELESEKLKKGNSLFLGVGFAFISYELESSSQRFLSDLDFTGSVSILPYVGYRLMAGRNIPNLGLQFWLGGYGYRTTGTHNWTNDLNQRATETMINEVRSVYAATEILLGIKKNNLFYVEPGLGLGVNYPYKITSRYTTTEPNLGGGTLQRDQIPFYNILNLRVHAFIQFNFLVNHTARIFIIPKKTMDNLSDTRPKEQLFSISYHYNFRKK